MIFLIILMSNTIMIGDVSYSIEWEKSDTPGNYTMINIIYFWFSRITPQFSNNIQNCIIICPNVIDSHFVNDMIKTSKRGLTIFYLNKNCYRYSLVNYTMACYKHKTMEVLMNFYIYRLKYNCQWHNNQVSNAYACMKNDWTLKGHM